MGRYCLLCTAVVIVAAGAPEAQGPAIPAVTVNQRDDTPPLNEIIGRALDRARAQDEAKAELRFQSIVETTVRLLDEDERVTETDTSRSRRYPIEGAVYEEVIRRNGRPLTDDERRDEAEKREKFRRKAAEAAADGETIETNDERQVRFDGDLMARYHASVVGDAVVNGDLCWVVEFEPRDGRLPEETRMDRALNNSAGRIYITQDEAAVSRIEFELQEPVSYVWGLIASLRKASGRLDFARAEPDVWLPTLFDIRVDLRILFRTTRRHIVRTWIERTRAQRQRPGPRA